MNDFFRFARMESGENRLYIEGPLMPNDAPYAIPGDMTAPSELRKRLAELEGQPLTVVIDSPGGDFATGVAIYEELRRRSGVTRAEVYRAYSAASLILCGCDHGQRMMSPVGSVLIHNPACTAMGDHRDMRRAEEYLASLKEGVLQAYAAASGLSVEELSVMLDDEVIMSADRAIELGFADGVLGDQARQTTMRGYARASMEATTAAIQSAMRAAEDKERAEILRALQT